MEETSKQEFIGKLYALRAGLSVISQWKDELTDKTQKTVVEWAKAANKFVEGRNRYIFVGEVWRLMDIEYIEQGLIKAEFFMYMDQKELNNSTVAGFMHKNQQDEEYTTVFDVPSYGTTNASPKKFGFEDAGIEYSYRFKLPELGRCKRQVDRLNCELSPETIEEASFYRWLCSEESIRYFQVRLNYVEYEDRDANIKYFWPPKEKKRKLRRARRAEVAQIYKTIIGDLKALNQGKNGMKALQSERKDICGKGAAYNEALEQAFSNIIDPRDWQYLDLIIYYLETGRADTMKEALQLVEREIQTQRIIGAIEEASARICRTIVSAAEVISSQLNTISSQLSTAIMQQQIQIGQNQRLIVAADMQNALLKKANATSEQLASDVSYMKKYGIDFR